MAQTGYTPIQLYYSTTASTAPIAANLANGELAINVTDGKLFYKDNANAVQVIGWKTTPTSAGGTGLTSYTAGDLLYYATGTTLTKLAIGTAYQALQVNAGATAPSWQPSASSVLTTQGDLLYASAANTLARLAKNTTATRYLSNTGTSNNPDWAQINLTNGVTGTLPVGNGGTGLSSFTANRVLYASATNTVGTSSNFTFDGTNLSVTGSITTTGSNFALPDAKVRSAATGSIAIAGSYVITFEPIVSGIFSYELELVGAGNNNTRAVYFISSRYGSVNATSLSSATRGLGATHTVTAGSDGSSNLTITIANTNATFAETGVWSFTGVSSS